LGCCFSACLRCNCSFLCLDVKKGTERKIKAAEYFGVYDFPLAHAIQLVVLRPPQTVLLTKPTAASVKSFTSSQNILRPFEILIRILLSKSKLASERWQNPKMCEIDSAGPLFGRACGKQHYQFGFLGALSLILSLDEQRKNIKNLLSFNSRFYFFTQLTFI
jgi:hypothetical protein